MYSPEKKYKKLFLKEMNITTKKCIKKSLEKLRQNATQETAKCRCPNFN